MIVVGQLFLVLGLVAAVVAIAALFWGRSLGEKQGEGATNVGYLATFAAFGSYTVSVAVMWAAFFGNDFTFQYVAENHPTDVSALAPFYTISAIWAGREGSLLFWAWLVAMFAAYVAYRRMEITDAVSNMGLAVTNIILALFSSAMIFSTPNNPFKATPANWLGPNNELLVDVGMNPLLQHWAMMLHPPTLFIGYAGLAIPFAFALGALIVNDPSKKWIEITDRITVFAWLFLGAGNGLGAIWAYVVLGWGGYWAWDPVENASLLPWLTGVGLIHSFTIYRRRGAFKRWTLVLAAVTFSFVILGTFITRSGIVQSVHAFQADPVSFYLFGFMIIAPLIAIAAGIFIRGKSFDSNDEFESLTSKESAYYFNNVLMLLAGVLVAYMTVSSALPSWLPFGGRSIGITSYDLLARPIGILYAFILAVCPILFWRKTDGSQFWSRVKWPLVASVPIFALLVWEWASVLRPIYDSMVALGGESARPFLAWGPSWVYHGIGLLGFLAAAFILTTTGSLFINGALARSKAKGENFFASLGHIIIHSRKQSGGYLAHLAIGIILIGLVGSSMYVRDVRLMVDIEPGTTFQVDNYEFTYRDTVINELPNGDVESSVILDVSRDGRQVGQANPGRTQFARQGQTRLDAAVVFEPLRDIFLVWEGNQGEQMSINVKVNPLIWFAWGGFILLMIGSAIAMIPSRSRPRLAPADSPVVASKKKK
jgi:cytochrome c-type biogenesis protein CcmF